MNAPIHCTCLFRGLPQELRALGDSYVRDEFRRHKDADVSFVPVFMTEWTVKNMCYVFLPYLGQFWV